MSEVRQILRRLAGPAAIVGFAVLVAKLVALVKERVIAREIGAGIELDIFLFSYMVPAFLVNVFASTILNGFIPAIARIRAAQGANESNRFAGEAAVATAGVLLALALVLSLPLTSLAPGLAGGFDTQARERMTLLILLMMPLLVINGLSFFWSGYLNIAGRYGVPAIVSSVTPAIVLLMVLNDFGSRASIVLATGTLVGGAAELLLLLVLSRKAGAILFARPNFARPDWRGMVSQYLPAVAAAVLTAITAVIDQTFAASLAEGSVSILSYGTRLAAVAASLMIVTVSAVALPAFTVPVAEGQWTKVWDTLIAGCAVTFLAGALIALVVSLRSEAIVAAFFGGGRFSHESIALAAAVQAAYIWHLPFYAAGMVILRALLAMSMSTVVLLGSVANLVTDVIANVLLVPVLGVVGIGYATTLMYAVGFVLLGSLAMSEVRSRRASESRK